MGSLPLLLLITHFILFGIYVPMAFYNTHIAFVRKMKIILDKLISTLVILHDEHTETGLTIGCQLH